ncbi:MFS transporter [Kineosporia sp. R_H_3]|uniref:MFS transporter n=1 Tax=Kineosporia sp. R_H_3 TaxID=1961848 RepID=UPI0018E91BCD|nr:MFS transporter [Kineosporia sp. R_H_3]
MLLATILGSGMAMLDSTVVNVALPSIGADLDADVAGLQWTANGYLLTLSALILLGGSLGDRLGRRRVFVVGTVWFAAASLLCGLAPSVWTLVAARMLQGVGGALLTPGSLAIISAAFAPSDRGRAIGAWSGLMGIFGAAGPFVGGWLISAFSWRWAFLVNVPVALAVVLVTLRHVPESRGSAGAHEGAGPWHGLDAAGAALAATALGLVSWALVTWPERGAGGAVLVAGLAGLAAGAAFVVVERRVDHPMVPMSLFSARAFSATNATTFLVYAGLGGMFFLLVLTLQVVAGFSPLAAGAALLPVTLIMLVLSPRMGGLVARTGPRLPMVVGPLVAAAGAALTSRLGADAQYLRDVVPPIAVFGLGMAVTVAPLTTTVLAAAPDRYAGVASGINNAVARAGGLLTVAALPLVVGLTGDAYRDPALLLPAFRTGLLLCAALLAAGAVVSAVALPRNGSGQAQAISDSTP